MSADDRTAGGQEQHDRDVRSSYREANQRNAALAEVEFLRASAPDQAAKFEAMAAEIKELTRERDALRCQRDRWDRVDCENGTLRVRLAALTAAKETGA